MNYCNNCEYFKHDDKTVKVGKDYQGPTHPVGWDPNQRVVYEFLCLCTKANNRLIKNLGIELMEKEFEMVREREKEIREVYDGNYIPVLNEVFDDYMNNLKLEIPDWCPLKKN